MSQLVIIHATAILYGFSEHKPSWLIVFAAIFSLFVHKLDIFIVVASTSLNNDALIQQSRVGNLLSWMREEQLS